MMKHVELMDPIDIRYCTSHKEKKALLFKIFIGSQVWLQRSVQLDNDSQTYVRNLKQ